MLNGFPNRFRRIGIGVLIVTSLGASLKSQTSENFHKISETEVSLSGYAEVYYAYDFNEPVTGQKPAFLYNHTNHHSPAFNLMFLKTSLVNREWRASGAIMGGTYSIYNLSHEPGILRHVMEANVGIRLARSHNVWLDAGIFPSHIGFESAVGDDCWTLTRSIVAENSPYYEAGIRLNSLFWHEKLSLSVLALTGWQRVLPVAANNFPSGGWQLNYKPDVYWQFNYSGFAGNIHTKEDRQFRFYHNVYMVYEKGKFGLTAGLDIGHQKNRDISRHIINSGSWYTPVIIARLKATNKLLFALRAEYFNDTNAFITESFSSRGLNVIGLSYNADIVFNTFIKLRLEWRTFRSNTSDFKYRQKPSSSNSFFTTSLIVNFD
jgi:hypothetical protein